MWCLSSRREDYFHVAGLGVLVRTDVEELIAHTSVVLVADARGPVANFLEVGQLLGVEVE